MNLLAFEINLPLFLLPEPLFKVILFLTVFLSPSTQFGMDSKKTKTDSSTNVYFLAQVQTRNRCSVTVCWCNRRPFQELWEHVHRFLALSQMTSQRNASCPSPGTWGCNLSNWHRVFPPDLLAILHKDTVVYFSVLKAKVISCESWEAVTKGSAWGWGPVGPLPVDLMLPLGSPPGDTKVGLSRIPKYSLSQFWGMTQDHFTLQGNILHLCTEILPPGLIRAHITKQSGVLGKVLDMYGLLLSLDNRIVLGKNKLPTCCWWIHFLYSDA